MPENFPFIRFWMSARPSTWTSNPATTSLMPTVSRLLPGVEAAAGRLDRAIHEDPQVGLGVGFTAVELVVHHLADRAQDPGAGLLAHPGF